MELGVDFRFRDELTSKDPKATVPIELLMGPYAGAIFRFTNVQVREKNNNEAAVKFDYEVLQKAPHTNQGKMQRDEKFLKTLGLILNTLILDLTENETKKQAKPLCDELLDLSVVEEPVEVRVRERK